MAQYIQVGNDLVEFPDNMSDEQIANVLKGQAQPQSKQAPEQKFSGFLMGLKDPISGGAQLLEKALPKSLVNRINMVNNELAKYGLVSPVGAGGVTELVAKEQQAYQAQRQAQGEGENIDFSRVAGNVLSPANLAVGGVAGSLVTAPARQAAIVGASQGVLMPTDTTTDFAEEKARQAALGAVGGVVGGAVVKGAGKVLNPVVSAAEQRLTDLGVKLTPGQLIGSPARDLEAFASNVPYVGPSISAAKERAVESFNKGVVNKTLAKINDKLPENVAGRNAILYASDQVSNAYDDVLSKMNFDLNFKVSSDMLGALNKSSLPSEAQKMAAMDILNRTALSRFDKQTLTGAEYKLIESDLRKEASGYLNSTTQAEKQIGQALRNVLDVFKKELAVQNPKQTSNLRRIDAAYGDLEVIQTAAANSGAQNGIFTPKQYQTAVRQRDISRNKKSFARGTARGQDVSDAALDIMGESSTATLEGRLAAGATGVYGLLQNPAVAAGLAVTAPIMYSESGINAMNALMRSRPEIAQRIGKQLTDRATREGSITGAQVLEEYNRSLAPRIELNGMAR
jgi:hypothetical protein